MPLDPTIGHEHRGTRPALLLAIEEFDTLGEVLVAPIAPGGDFARCAGFAVAPTGTGCKTQGVALVNRIRMLDVAARKAREIERAPQEVIDDAIGRPMAMLDRSKQRAPLVPGSSFLSPPSTIAGAHSRQTPDPPGTQYPSASTSVAISCSRSAYRARQPPGASNHGSGASTAARAAGSSA